MTVHSPRGPTMPHPNQYKSNLRDLTFLLFEQFKLGDLLGKAPYANWGKDEVLAVVDEAYGWVQKHLGPYNRSGDDDSAITTATRRPDGKYDIRGVKIFISGGDHDMTDNIVHMVLARTPDAPPGTKGLSLFIVPKRRPDGTPNDVTVGGIEHKMGIRASTTAVLDFGGSGGGTG